MGSGPLNSLGSADREAPTRHAVDGENDALVGFTGFVGANLDRARHFGSRFNSSNVDKMTGGQFRTVVCAGTTAEKWRANQHPAEDRAGMLRLWDVLRTVTAKTLVLISTVDVYPNPSGVDESTEIRLEDCHAYGRHRLELERLAADRFESVILRLPGLFGPGLKKNALYDLLHDHETDRIDSRSVFQFYDVARLAELIDETRKAAISLLNVATQPLSLEEIAEDCFGTPFVNHVSAAPARYDFRSRHAERLGGRSGYIHEAAVVRRDIRHWVQQERSARA